MTTPNERDRGEILWSPPPDAWATTQVGRFGTAQGHGCWDDLLHWSIEHPDAFWTAVADWFRIPWSVPPGDPPILGPHTMPGARWFEGSELNYAELALRRALESPNEIAVVGRSQSPGADVSLTGAELVRQVRACRSELVRLGVRRGERVVAYAPNTVPTLVAFLATASLGAIWASCPPEFGTRAVIDRFAQLDPAVLFAVDGYHYGTKRIDKRADADAIAASLPTLRHIVRMRHLGSGPDEFGERLEAAARDAEALAFESLPFAHPLYVLFSSGTTGLPKAIVHGHGGVVLEHLKSIGFHHDLGPGDRFFWFSTTGWMMWNYLVSGLLVGSSIVLYDGDPMHPGDDALWTIADETGCTMFGASAGYLMHCRKAGVRPRRGKLRSVGSTGAPLPAEGYRWVYEVLGSDDLVLASISGGTDVCTAFLGMSPVTPVRAGEIATRSLGIAAEAADPEGRICPPGTMGELVITRPMPSMPIGLWGDESGERLEATYYSDFPGWWRHGDWVVFHPDGHCVVTGRSDATLNRGGVRLGSGDFYALVEAIPEVSDSLVVHLERDDDPSGHLVLFIVTALPDAETDALITRIHRELRQQLSPRHVPDRTLRVSQIPRTLSGKKLEVPVKRVLLGAEPTSVASRDSLTDPNALEEYVELRRTLSADPSA